MHLRLSGNLPHVVLGWRTHDEQYDIPPELVAVYGPVDTSEDAERLVTTLLESFPGDEDNYTVMATFPVRPEPGAESVVIAL